jgi:branched-chain amino acid transport system permease protein
MYIPNILGKVENVLPSLRPKLLRMFYYFGVVPLVLLLLLIAPLIGSTTQLRWATEIMYLALFAVSYDILIGYTKVLSFGHALPFGVAAYTLAFVIGDVEVPLVPTSEMGLFSGIVFSLLVVAAVMLITGGLALGRTSGIYFALITLAFAQMGYEIVIKTSGITGGDDGLLVFFPAVLGFDMTDPVNVYYTTAISVAICYGLMWWMMKTPFGLVLKAIGDNPERSELIGIETYRFQIAAYVISGLFAGVAGMLMLLSLSIASPASLHWTTTADAVLMTVVGGMGTLVGPIVGALLIFSAEQFASGILLQFWPVLVGILFVGVVLLFPNGIVGTAREMLNSYED